MADDDFEPRLGRHGNAGRAGRTYAGRVVVTAGLNASAKRTGAAGFTGRRIGRGASIGRLLSTRGSLTSLRARRVVVKTSLVRLAGRGIAAARAHLHYIQRDGVTRDGRPGELYGPVDGPDPSAGSAVDPAGRQEVGQEVGQEVSLEIGRNDAETRIDGREFLARCSADRHQFRFIVSAEDGDRYDELKPLVRRLMGEIETDLGTRLDWVAVDHHNTGHPHTHIVLRGIEDTGKDLVIARDYIANGIRERAIELVTRDLGPRLDHEIEHRLAREIDQERLTTIDRRLLDRMDDDRCVVARSNDPVFHALETGRLRTLARMDLAEPVAPGRWRLAPGLEPTLRAMGERGDIIRLMQREMTRVRLERERHIHTPDQGPLVGRLVTRGLSDEHRDRHYLIVDGIDGRSHHLDIGAGSAVDQLPKGALVRAVPRVAGVRDIDRTIVAVARANGGRYSHDLHLRHDPSATRAFVETHERRLEAMRRARLARPRQIDGSWAIPDDHLGNVEVFEARRVRDHPVTVEVLATRPLEGLARTDAATWLDRELVSPTIEPPRDGGFGRELRDAFAVRRQWLIAQELASEGPDGFQLRRGALAILQRRELLRLADALADETGKTFVEARLGRQVEGKIARRIDAMSGSYALVEKSREFTLVPWRAVLEKQIGKQGSGLMRESGINWQFGKGRQGPEIG